MLKTKSIYYDKYSYSDGIRILVTRHYPRGVKRTKFHRWYRDLAPSKELLKLWKQNKISEKEYRKIYLEEMQNQESINVIKEIIVLLRKGHNVTLLCVEKEGMFCHRHILKDVILKSSIFT